MRYQSKQALVAAIDIEHDGLCAQLGRIPKSRYHERGVWGDDWTVCDLVAHLAEWQAMFLRWYGEGLQGETPGVPAPGYKWNETPRLNRAIWRKHRQRSFESVRADFDAGHVRMVELAARLPARELLEAGHFAWTGRLPLATFLGANSASHYRFASKILKRWLSSRPSAEGQHTQLHAATRDGHRPARRASVRGPAPVKRRPR